jgi:DNA polymerase-3 subunit gamma/tau
MSTESLYRKYRPSNFDEVIGQNHVTDVLQSALEKRSFAHAYLFFGSRGTGKTSVARILAKELKISDNDVIEIDAASNRGIDDIRALRDSVSTRPFDSEYKMYIIDEVHMLTKEAFNALLKTLEEPPQYVLFVLATTELHKIPDTIISRCQMFTFKEPNQTILSEMVDGLAKKEGIKIEKGGAELIAFLGNGSFRDTQSIMQKVLSFASDKKISRDEIERVTGLPSQELVYDFLGGIIEESVEKSINAVHTASEQNIDAELFTRIILKTLRTGLLLRYAPAMKKELLESLSESDVTFFKEEFLIAKNMNAATVVRMLEVLPQIDQAHIKTLPLELAVIDLVG